MFLITILDMITPNVSHLFFQFSIIEKIISTTFSNLLKIFIWLCSLNPIYKEGFDLRVDYMD